MRVCHPGPVAFQRANVSGGKRMEIDVRAVPDFGRPRGFSSRLAAGAPKTSGRTSLAGFAFANVAFVHSGFSTDFRGLTVLRFIASDLTPICFAETDHVNAPCTRRKHQCMQPPSNQSECLESSLSVVSTGVFDHKRTIPFKLFDQLKRKTALGDVPDVFSRIKADGHSLLYIRIYSISSVTLNAASQLVRGRSARAKVQAESGVQRRRWPRAHASTSLANLVARVSGRFAVVTQWRMTFL